MASVISVTGKVKRIYPDRGGCYISLAKRTPDVQPKNGYFRLKIDHANYKSLFSLALFALSNNFNLSIRVVGEVDPSQDSIEIEYMYVDNPQL